MTHLLTFDEFCERSEKKTAEIAAELDITPVYVGLLRRKLKPGAKLMERIYYWSGGLVQPNSWFDLPLTNPDPAIIQTVEAA